MELCLNRISVSKIQMKYEFSRSFIHAWDLFVIEVISEHYSPHLISQGSRGELLLLRKKALPHCLMLFVINTRTTEEKKERCGKFCFILSATLHFISRDAIVSRYKSRVWKSPSREYPCDPSGKPSETPTKRLPSGLSSDRSMGSVPQLSLAKIRGT